MEWRLNIIEVKCKEHWIASVQLLLLLLSLCKPKKYMFIDMYDT